MRTRRRNSRKQKKRTKKKTRRRRRRRLAGGDYSKLAKTLLKESVQKKKDKLEQKRLRIRKEETIKKIKNLDNMSPAQLLKQKQIKVSSRQARKRQNLPLPRIFKGGKRRRKRTKRRKGTKRRRRYKKN